MEETKNTVLCFYKIGILLCIIKLVFILHLYVQDLIYGAQVGFKFST